MTSSPLPCEGREVCRLLEVEEPGLSAVRVSALLESAQERRLSHLTRAGEDEDLRFTRLAS